MAEPLGAELQLDALQTRLAELERAHAEHARIDQELRASEARLRLVVAERDRLVERLQLQIDRMPIGCIVADEEFRFTEWNRAAERIFGFTRDEMLGRHPFGTIVPESAQAYVSDIFAKLAEGDKASQGVNVNTTRDGRRILCEWQNMPLYRADGAFDGILSMAQDVTERERAEEALRESERRFHLFMDASPVIAFIKDDAGRYVYGNKAWMGQFSGDGLWALGKTDQQLWPESTAAVFHRSDRIVFETETPVSIEEAGPGPDGAIQHWHVLKFPIRDAAGRRLLGGIVQNVSDRVRMQDQLRQSQKMEAVGRLAGGVAHDFNNLLTVITGFCSLAQLDLPADHPSFLHMEEVQRAADRAAGMTRQLLAVSRRQVLAPRLLTLNQVVEDMERLLRRLISENIALVSALEGNPWAVMADPSQVEQVLLNLAVNARDAMPEGGVLTIETSNIVLDEHYARLNNDVTPGDYVVLAVSDTGKGMNADVQAHIFEPFFTTKGPGEGTGLGLATVYGVVKQSGGHVAVSSVTGRGSTFKVYLPRSSLGAASAQTAVRDSTAPAGLETVLLVEDEIMVRTVARRALESWGYTVLEAGNGVEALELVARFAGKIHLLVTDVIMPQMGGPELAERMAVVRPDTRVLFISGYTDSTAVQQRVNDEGTPYLTKPFTPAALAQAARSALDRKP